MDRSSHDPFDDIERMFERMTQQFGGAQVPFGGGSIPVDLREEPDRFVLEADVPGFEPDDIALQVSEGRRVDISAEHTDETATEGGDDTRRFITRERHRESLSRTVTLPEAVDEEATEAGYDAGVLTVSLPKRTVDDEGTDIPVS